MGGAGRFLQESNPFLPFPRAPLCSVLPVCVGMRKVWPSGSCRLSPHGRQREMWPMAMWRLVQGTFLPAAKEQRAEGTLEVSARGGGVGKTCVFQGR